MTDKELKDLVKSMETRELDDEARKNADGEFIRLSFGHTHYELKGEGEAVVLVHGYATPYFIYDKLTDEEKAEADVALRSLRQRAFGQTGRGLYPRVLRHTVVRVDERGFGRRSVFACRHVDGGLDMRVLCREVSRKGAKTDVSCSGGNG